MTEKVDDQRVESVGLLVVEQESRRRFIQLAVYRAILKRSHASGADLAFMLTLPWWCNASGDCYPSVGSLAEMNRMTERAIQDRQRRLSGETKNSPFRQQPEIQIRNREGPHGLNIIHVCAMDPGFISRDTLLAEVHVSAPQVQGSPREGAGNRNSRVQDPAPERIHSERIQDNQRNERAREGAQRDWWAVQAHFQKNMGADTFDQLFSGVQVVGVNRKEIQVTVQPALLELAIKQGGVDLAENRLTEYALDACKAGLGDFLKGRRLKIVP